MKLVFLWAICAVSAVVGDTTTGTTGSALVSGDGDGWGGDGDGHGHHGPPPCVASCWTPGMTSKACPKDCDTSACDAETKKRKEPFRNAHHASARIMHHAQSTTNLSPPHTRNQNNIRLTLILHNTISQAE